MMSEYHPDTIAAIATPLGEGAIGIVRLSGPDALSITDACFHGPRKVSEVRSHSLTHGRIVSDSGATLDDVLIAVMRGPNSFTGEDVVEIHCHGGVLVVEAVLRRVLGLGARPAQRGEFTQRAFFNGKLDLAQAEAVIDIIRAQSPVGLEVAARQLEGALSQRVQEARGAILRLIAHLQVVIDYPEEGVEELTDEEVIESILQARASIRTLLKGADAGKVYRDGLRLAIVGRPNVGKSSLLNALLREDRAIVTEIAGTTRDTIDAPALFGGIPFTLTDTAGIRETEDPVERIGVERTRKAVEHADVVLLLVDASERVTPEDRDVLNEVRRFAEGPMIVVANKADLPKALTDEDLSRFAPGFPVVWVSAATGAGLGELEEALTTVAVGNTGLGNDAILVTRARHRTALEQADRALGEAESSMRLGMTSDVVSVDLQEALESLGTITGESVAEEVVAHIFSEFCVGK